MAFQKDVRAEQGVAIPGTVVQASDTYKYIKKGVVGSKSTAVIGKFVVEDNSVKGYRMTKQGDTADKIAGICLLGSYITGDDNSIAYTEGQPVNILENGVVAVEVIGDKGDNDKITINLENGDIYVGTVTATITHKLELPAYKCVQHTGLAAKEKGIAFIKG